MQRIIKLAILCLGFAFMAEPSAAQQTERPVSRFARHVTAGPIIPEMQTDQAEAVPHGHVSVVSYGSPILKESRGLCIYKPPGYEKGEIRYPVLYLLHGEGGDENEWVISGRANLVIDDLIIQKKAEPMIVVMPNGNVKSPATPDEELFPKSLVEDLIPYIEEHYRVKDDIGNRAIAGLSMGGRQTMTATALYPRTFGYIGIWSAGTQLTDEQLSLRLSIIKNGGVKLYYVGCGVDDQLAHAGSMRLVEQLKKLDMWYRLKETPGGRTWSNWRLYLSDFATQIFK
jgi:enterochelin esterase family protein